MDRAFSALLEDLESRGLLDETLVVCMSEFGRTPRLETTQEVAGHWGSVFSVAMAGGGIRGGHTRSDKIGASREGSRASPRPLGHDLPRPGPAPATEYEDTLGRSHSSAGEKSWTRSSDEAGMVANVPGAWFGWCRPGLQNR